MMSITKSGKLNIPIRKDSSKLEANQLCFLFENFVLRCENDIKPLKYFYINSKEVKALKTELCFNITPKERKVKTIDYLPNENDFVFINDKNSAIASLLFHIRNAFVHNRISVDEKGKIEIIDYIPQPYRTRKELGKLKAKGKKRPKARITMYASISSFNKLKKIIQGLIDTQQ